MDEDVTMADLKGCLTVFARALFGDDRQVRFRCDYFPFVEPGVDMTIDCFLCGGKGCRLCKDTGWIEIMGAGMVHPQVLANVGYDPAVYTGFAFGMGPERIAMLKYGIDDIRHFYGNDLRFLRQFVSEAQPEAQRHKCIERALQCPSRDGCARASCASASRTTTASGRQFAPPYLGGSP